jgi:hypothetical protein
MRLTCVQQTAALVTFRIPDYGLENCTMSFGAYYPPKLLDGFPSSVGAREVDVRIACLALDPGHFLISFDIAQPGSEERAPWAAAPWLHELHDESEHSTGSNAQRLRCELCVQDSQTDHAPQHARPHLSAIRERHRHHAVILLQKPDRSDIIDPVPGRVPVVIRAAGHDVGYG